MTVIIRNPPRDDEEPDLALREGVGNLSILQWESFKMWEGFMAGCAVILPHLEVHGLELPTMPIAGEHYVAVDFEAAAIARLRTALASGALDLEAIGTAGRAWALANYSPVSFASAFARHVAEAQRERRPGAETALLM